MENKIATIPNEAEEHSGFHARELVTEREALHPSRGKRSLDTASP